jgi:peptidoglycan hydrolase CwlO-like protein
MQVNGWILGLGALIAVGSVAQAQIAPRTTTNEARTMASPEVSALRTEIASLKSAVAGLQSVNQNQEAKLLQINSELTAAKNQLASKSSINHMHSVVGGGLTGKGFCGAPTSGTAAC